MLKNHKWKLLASSLLILLPVLFGLLLWSQLPEQMITHWSADGTADGWSSRPIAVLVLPAILLLVHWICIFFTVKDPGNGQQNHKVLGMVLWICPLISLFTNAMVYSVAFGKEPQIDLLVLPLMGLMFIIIGNYLPKCKQNHTIGIKIKWTLENEENWNATHRFSGKLWVIGGLLLLFCAFLPDILFTWTLVIALLLLAIVPIAYSYYYHQKQVKEGTAVITPLPSAKANKVIMLISLVLTVLLLIFTGILMFTGNITVKYGEDSFTIEASYWNDLTVDYKAVDAIEYRDYDDAGSRTSGLGTARLLAGSFRNDEFGYYTRYSYLKCDACVVLTVDEHILVINASDTDATKALYEQLLARICQ